ncbi:hypothetical protein B0H11DRAFT_2191290 [Mycena galericulata]|nr:hypothetical protein B0H11DRAFT_2191290 [Mycena galericulata]
MSNLNRTRTGPHVRFGVQQILDFAEPSNMIVAVELMDDQTGQKLLNMMYGSFRGFPGHGIGSWFKKVRTCPEPQTEPDLRSGSGFGNFGKEPDRTGHRQHYVGPQIPSDHDFGIALAPLERKTVFHTSQLEPQLGPQLEPQLGEQVGAQIKLGSKLDVKLCLTPRLDIQLGPQLGAPTWCPNFA